VIFRRARARALSCVLVSDVCDNLLPKLKFGLRTCVGRVVHARARGFRSPMHTLQPSVGGSSAISG